MAKFSTFGNKTNIFSNYHFPPMFAAPLGKRGWKMYYCTLRDLVLYLHKDETETRTPPNLCEVSPHTIRVHHSLATKATEYRKKQHVFKLETADRAEYLFQTR
jgi:hypothetical protein